MKFAKAGGVDVIFIRDTHGEDYLDTNEGKHLPVVHCIKNTDGWQIIDELQGEIENIIDKPSFGSPKLATFIKQQGYEDIELIGLCTDICVVSNALLIRAFLPEAVVKVDAACFAGVTPDSHEAALKTMEMCQVDIIY